jgi:hypothetical protein
MGGFGRPKRREEGNLAEQWDGVERRSGGERRKGERRRSDAFSIERILNGTASRRSGRDRRQGARRVTRDTAEREAPDGKSAAAASGRQ